jgi:hypothetical protein
VELKFAAVGNEGDVLAGPVVIGTIDPRIDDGDTNADIAWTGSEFGVAFAEWAEPPEEGEEMRTMVKLLRLDEEGGFIGEPLSIYGESHSHTVRMAWTGSRYGISWLEPFHPHAMGHLHFAAAGCARPED